MQTLPVLRCGFALAVLALSATAHGAVANFDDLPSPPAVNSSTGLIFANDGSLDYSGVNWDSRFSVVGDAYRVSPPDGPLFGIPHSPHYFVTNQDGVSGLLITTSQVLTGAWFGRNQYYGFGSGADQVTIVALSGAAELQSVVFDLPLTNPDQPEPLSFVDTSVFTSLAGITGYRIDRRELGEQNGHWVADDFQFTAAVPIPAGVWLFSSALAGLGWLNRRR